MSVVFAKPGSFRVLISSPITHSDTFLKTLFQSIPNTKLEIYPQVLHFSFSFPHPSLNSDLPNLQAEISILKNTSTRGILIVRGSHSVAKRALETLEKCLGIATRYPLFDALKLNTILRKFVSLSHLDHRHHRRSGGHGGGTGTGGSESEDEDKDDTAAMVNEETVECLTFVIPKCESSDHISRIRIRGNVRGVMDGSVGIGGLRIDRLRLTAIDTATWAVDSKGRMRVKKSAKEEPLLEIIRELVR
eukprot:ANDGO_02628.mRNA.1 hypothetical protein